MARVYIVLRRILLRRIAGAPYAPRIDEVAVGLGVVVPEPRGDQHHQRQPAQYPKPACDTANDLLPRLRVFDRAYGRHCDGGEEHLRPDEDRRGEDVDPEHNRIDHRQNCMRLVASR